VSSSRRRVEQAVWNASKITSHGSPLSEDEDCDQHSLSKACFVLLLFLGGMSLVTALSGAPPLNEKTEDRRFLKGGKKSKKSKSPKSSKAPKSSKSGKGPILTNTPSFTACFSTPCNSLDAEVGGTNDSTAFCDGTLTSNLDVENTSGNTITFLSGAITINEISGATLDFDPFPDEGSTFADGTFLVY